MSRFACPCGCASTSWETDPACVTQQPISGPVDWAAYNGYNATLDAA